MTSKICNKTLDRISDNIAALVQTERCGAINTTDTTTMGYYWIKLMSEPYKLQEVTTCDKQISSAGEIILKAHYINFMKDNTK